MERKLLMKRVGIDKDWSLAPYKISSLTHTKKIIKLVRDALPQEIDVQFYMFEIDQENILEIDHG